MEIDLLVQLGFRAEDWTGQATQPPIRRREGSLWIRPISPSARGNQVSGLGLFEKPKTDKLIEFVKPQCVLRDAGVPCEYIPRSQDTWSPPTHRISILPNRCRCGRARLRLTENPTPNLHPASAGSNELPMPHESPESAEAGPDSDLPNTQGIAISDIGPVH